MEIAICIAVLCSAAFLINFFSAVVDCRKPNSDLARIREVADLEYIDRVRHGRQGNTE